MMQQQASMSDKIRAANANQANTNTRRPSNYARRMRTAQPEQRLEQLEKSTETITLVQLEGLVPILLMCASNFHG